MTGTFATAYTKFKTSTLVRRFLESAAWSVLGSVVAGGVTLTMLILVARMLGKEVYGQFVVIQSTLSMVGVFAGFGIGAAVTRYVAQLRTRDTVRLGHILALSERTVFGFGLFTSTGLVLTADWMAVYLLNAPGLSVPLAISACAVLFTALDSYQKSVLIGFESMRAFAIGTVTGVIAGFPIMLLSVNYFGLKGAAVAMVANALLQAGISRNQMARELQKYKIERRAKDCLSEWPVLWHFAFPAMLAGALVGPAHWGAQALLANAPNGYAELAVLGIAMQWFNVIMFVPGTAGRALLPILTDHVTKNEHSNSQKVLLYSMGAYLIVALPLTVIIGILSPYIMSLYGKEFENQYVPLIVAVITAAMLAIQTPVGTLLVAKSRLWLGLLMNFGWAIIYIVIAYLLLDFGALGVLFALGIAYLVNAALVLTFAHHYLGSKA